MVLKTELSEPEKELFSSDIKYKYYVTEKNTQGVLWSVFYDWQNATSIKIDHSGNYVNRDSVHLLQERTLKGSNVYTITDLKRHMNTEAMTKYWLLTTNCHKYALDMSLLLQMGEISNKNLLAVLRSQFE